MRSVVLATLLAGAVSAQAALAGLETRIRAGDGAAWEALAGHDPVPEAIAAARALLAGRPADAAGWTALGRLADRSQDYLLGVDAGHRAVEAALAGGDLERAAEAELKLAARHARIGATLAEIRAQRRRQEILRRLGRDLTTQETERIRQIEASIHRKASATPESLEAEAGEARAAGNHRRERVVLIYLANHHWAAGEFRAGLEAYRRILALHDALKPDLKNRARDWNGAGRLALDLALTLDGEERDRLLAEARGWAEAALDGHRKTAERSHVELIWDHCLLGHVMEASGRDADALGHHREEMRLVLEERAVIERQGDEALRVFHGERHHIFDDFAIFLARGGPERPADPRGALRVSEDGRVGALRELYLLRGRTAPAWMGETLPLESLVRRAGVARAAVVVYLTGSHEAAAVTITGGGIRCVPLGRLEALDAAAREFSDAAADLRSSRRRVGEAGAAAFERLLRPALPEGEDIRRLVLVGTGRWPRLPFAALVVPGEGRIEDRFLARRFEIAFAPTLGALAGGAAAGSASGPPLVAGWNGVPPASWVQVEDFRPLDRAEAEAASVAERLGAAGPVLRASTEAAFRSGAGSAPLLHVAAHALVDDEDTLRSAIVLGPAEGGDDGLLSLGDVLGLDLRARLVVLSGCRTAGGARYFGEGVTGLARAFLVAGAGAVVVSLSPVDDRCAPHFAAALASEVAAGGPIPAAFARAQRALLDKPWLAHPALWAPFVLHGQSGLLE